MMIRALSLGIGTAGILAIAFAALVSIGPNPTIPVSVYADGRVFEGTVRDSGPLSATLSFKGQAEDYFVRESGEHVYLLSQRDDGYCFQMESQNTVLQMPKGSAVCKRNY